MSRIKFLAENKRTQPSLKHPTLKFFKSASSGVNYVGPQSLSDLSLFINKEMGRVTTATNGT